MYICPDSQSQPPVKSELSLPISLCHYISINLLYVSFKQREISKAQPLGKPGFGNDTIKTSGSFLTIRGIRSVKNSKNYNVEFTIRASKCRNLVN